MNFGCKGIHGRPRAGPSGARIVLLAWFACSVQGADFSRDIRPLLSDKCFKCHGPDAATRKADLRLDLEEEAKRQRKGSRVLVPGNPESSELVRRIFASDPDERMPPPESQLSLSAVEKGLLRRWVEEGAPWEGHWAWQSPVRPALPEVSDPAWPLRGLDYFVLARLDREGWQPAPPADRARWIRRVTLDLTGLPPTLAEVDAFLADAAPGAHDRVIDRLLDSPHFGERMAFPWLEAARYADTDGYQNDGPRDMWRWRDWVIEAFNRNLPFDEFTIEQLAGDLLPAPTLDQLIATGFNRNNRYNSEAGLVLEEFLLENAVDRVDTTATVWMGLTLGCARCHSHKYDPFTQEEYYQMISFFDNVPESGRAIKFGNSEPWIKAPTSEHRDRLQAREKDLEQAESVIRSGLPEIDESLEGMEQPPKADAIVVQGGLAYRFALDAEEKGVEVESGTVAYESGMLGKAVVLDGKSSLALGKIGDFRCNAPFAISFWMKPQDVREGAVLSQETGDTTRKGMLVEFREGHLQFHVISRWLAGVATRETEQTLRPGEWVHVTLVNDGTQRADGMEIWLDGRRVAARTIRNTNSNQAAKPYGGVLRLGHSPHAPSYRGLVDELRIYHRSLIPREIALLAESTPVADIASQTAETRTSRQQSKLRYWYLETGGAERWRRAFAARERARFAYEAQLDEVPTTMVMRDTDPPRRTHVRIRGGYDALGPEVQPGTPALFPPLNSGSSANRLDFARWLVSGDHPLTARVAVNRYWQMLFGTGLVRTPEDFGSQGEAPTHPQLLDWLATEYVRLGWDTKAFLKLLTGSATYRQASEVSSDRLAWDPDNRWLARGPRVRLSAAMIRDQALFVSGLLTPTLGGPSVKPYQPARLWAEISNFKYTPSKGADLYRRSLYTYWKRTVAPPTLAALDAADRESCAVRPKRTNTPLQALTLLNETAFVEAARKLGERILREGGGTDEQRVRHGFRRVLSRPPTALELEQLVAALGDFRQDFRQDPRGARSLVKVGESAVPEDLDTVELATATLFANLLLNLDETLTKE